MIKQLFKDIINFEFQAKEISKITPKSFKIVISKDMIPWLEVLRIVINNGADIEFIKKGLWQMGVYQYDTPSGNPECPFHREQYIWECQCGR